MGLEHMTKRLRALRSTNWARSALYSLFIRINKCLWWINLFHMRFEHHLVYLRMGNFMLCPRLCTWDLNITLYGRRIRNFTLCTRLCNIGIGFTIYLLKFSINDDHGVEPMTTRLRALCSTNWARSVLYSLFNHINRSLSWINPFHMRSERHLVFPSY